MWWLLLLALTIIVAAVVVAWRRGPQMPGATIAASVHDGEHMIGVEMSRHSDSGSTGGGAL
ncbi:hypothetical protein GCM10023168_36450 [Fodinibacter luteus]|uniref:Uncharacterized protein n=1 Tax=Fodinibacter luteus TaxID=552064 RepID=A0ABP8KR98_9MICO